MEKTKIFMVIGVNFPKKIDVLLIKCEISNDRWIFNIYFMITECIINGDGKTKLIKGKVEVGMCSPN